MAVTAPDLTHLPAWRAGYAVWLTGHKHWEQFGEFPEATHGIESNPFPADSIDHDAWERGWGAALDDYDYGIGSGE